MSTTAKRPVRFKKNSGHVQLFIPGPTEVAPDVMEAFATPQIGHRTPEFKDLYNAVRSGLRTVLKTEGFVFIAPTSATGMWEGASRNTVKKGCLNIDCGAFSNRWHKVTTDHCGLPGENMAIGWGGILDVDDVRKKLQTGAFDTVTMVHNETSTSGMYPIKDVAAMIRNEFPDVLILVDAVSSMTGVDIAFDEWGLDVLLAGMQKCFALPAGMAIAAVSERTLERAKTIPHRGYLLDFVLGKEKDEASQTISTPNIAALFGMRKVLENILEEGLENRFQRHADMAELVWKYTAEHWGFYIPEGYRSHTVTAVKNTRKVDIAKLCSDLKGRGIGLSNGYGKIKGETFRIGHMGDWGVEDIRLLLNEINDVLKLPPVA